MHWTRGHTLGRGSTATVSIAEAGSSGQVFAVKSAELHQSECLKREQGILSTLSCPQIVGYKGCDITLENGVLLYNMLMEYAPHGTLADAVRSRRHNGGLDEALVGSYTRQILLGLYYLHSNGIVHCDVKGQNVLVTEQGAKIADLGCARRVADSGGRGVIAGTPVFMAPEVARGEQQGFPADVWALGCTVLEMITGEAPWACWGDASDPVTALYRIGFAGEVPEIPNCMSEKGKDFLGKCLKREASERWSVGELLGHGFVEEVASSLELKESAFEFDDECNLDTPTSVFGRGFWDSLQTTQNNLTRHCSWNSATPTPRDRDRDRIRGLCAEAEPNWEWDDRGWITVRSNEVKVKELANSLVIFYEPKSTVITSGIGLSRCSATNIADCYCSNSYSCCNSESLSGCLCIKIVPKGKIDSQNKEIFGMLCFLLLLSPSL